MGEVRNLTEKLEESSVKLRQLEWNLEDAVKEKSNITEKYGTQKHRVYKCRDPEDRDLLGVSKNF